MPKRYTASKQPYPYDAVIEHVEWIIAAHPEYTVEDVTAALQSEPRLLAQWQGISGQGRMLIVESARNWIARSRTESPPFVATPRKGRSP